MTGEMICKMGKRVSLALWAVFLVSLPAMGGEMDSPGGVRMNAEKLAGINLPVEEAFMAPEDVLKGEHRPRGEILHYGEELIVEVYEDEPATFRFDEPFIYDEFVTILSGKLILTATGGQSQEYVAGETLVVPKGFTGTWQMLGNFRELIVINRESYEAEYGVAE